MGFAIDPLQTRQADADMLASAGCAKARVQYPRQANLGIETLRFLLRLSTGLTVLVAPGAMVAPHLAMAQDRLPRSLSSYVFQNEAPSKLVAAAFGQPYGRAIVAEFSAALAETADSACLKTKRIAKEQLTDRARPMLLERGAYLLEHGSSMIDQAAFKTHLQARIGTDGVAEVERLLYDPLVRGYMVADEPARLAYVAAYVVEYIQRYTRIMRIAFARPFSPIDSDILAIDKLDPTDKVDAALKEMVANDTSGTLARYLELVLIAQKPLHDAIDMVRAERFGPGELLARPGKDRWDLRDELAEICVGYPAATRSE